MVLTVDLGNSTLSWVLHEGGVPLLRGAAGTKRPLAADVFAGLTQSPLAEQIDRIFIASVVPDLDASLEAMCRNLLGVAPVFLDYRKAGALRFAIDDPAELGADRIAACLGALDLARPPMLVIDSGTATTFDLVDREKTYQGGAIAPGLDLLLRSLSQNTAKLMDVPFEIPRSLIGKNTREHILIGAHALFVAGIEQLVGAYRELLGPRVTVLASGGTFSRMPGLPRGIDRYEADLVHIGLRGMEKIGA